MSAVHNVPDVPPYHGLLRTTYTRLTCSPKEMEMCDVYTVCTKQNSMQSADMSGPNKQQGLRTEPATHMSPACSRYNNNSLPQQQQSFCSQLLATPCVYQVPGTCLSYPPLTQANIQKRQDSSLYDLRRQRRTGHNIMVQPTDCQAGQAEPRALRQDRA